MSARANIHCIGLALVVALSTSTASAVASGGTAVCVPSAQNKPIVTPKAGACKPSYTLTELGAEGKEGKEGKQGPEGKNTFSETEITTLKSILPFVKLVENGVAGKPTIQFSGVNVQVINGVGKTDSINGAGNIVLGYDENPGTLRRKPGEQLGSHDLILGTQQAFTSYAGIVAGQANTVTGPFASVNGGVENTASGGGAAVAGGRGNTAQSFFTSVGGGILNRASGEDGSVSGGYENTASGKYASASGGEFNTASAEKAWIGGGFLSKAEGTLSAIFGGKELKTSKEFEAIP